MNSSITSSAYAPRLFGRAFAQCAMALFLVFTLIGVVEAKSERSSVEIFRTTTAIQAAKVQAQLQGFITNPSRNSAVLEASTALVAEILAKADKSVRLTLPALSGKAAFTLVLERADVLTPDALVVAETDDGTKLVDMHGKFVAYYGTVEGDAQSRVVLTISPLGMFANLETHGTTYEYSPLQSWGLGGNTASQNTQFPTTKKVLIQSEETRGMYVVYDRATALGRKGFQCNNPNPSFSEEALKLGASLKERKNTGTETHAGEAECEVALEIGHRSFEKYRTVENAVAYYLNVMANVNQIYIRDANARTPVVYARVWATTTNPYQNLVKDSGAFLEALTKEWEANQRNIPCDAVTMCEFFDGNGSGIANMNPGSFHSCAAGMPSLNVNFCEDKFAPFTMYSDDVSLLAHELGHNFGSPHTHSCYWRAGNPIDTCNKLEAPENGGSCGSDTTIATKIVAGTIMSYCDVNGGDEGKRIYRMEFHPLCKDLMQKAAREAVCLQARVVSPNPTSLLAPANNAMNTARSNVAFSWDAVQGALAYQFQLSTSQSFDSTAIVLDSAGITRTSLTLTRQLRDGTRYYWRVRYWNGSVGGIWQTAPFNFTTMTLSSVRTAANAVVRNLECAPNPVTRESIVRFTLVQSGKVRLELVNLLGQQTALLLDAAAMGSGEHSISFANSSLSTGVYYLRLTVGDAVLTLPVSVVR